MWKTNKAHKLRLEKETDERIMRDKEKAMKRQEPSISFMQVSMKLKSNCNGTVLKVNSFTKTGEGVFLL